MKKGQKHSRSARKHMREAWKRRKAQIKKPMPIEAEKFDIGKHDLREQIAEDLGL
jgi:hypothetical protein